MPVAVLALAVRATDTNETKPRTNEHEHEHGTHGTARDAWTLVQGNEADRSRRRTRDANLFKNECIPFPYILYRSSYRYSVSG